LNVIVNGERKELSEGIHIVDLLDRLGLKPERLAVEVNQSIVRRAEWTTTTLLDGDKVEIVHFVGGGCGDPSGWVNVLRSAKSGVARYESHEVERQ
jgi:thiamine biosynthesis protein ThiS